MIWAHSRNGAGNRQSLEDHARGTALRAKEFASAFDEGDAAFQIGYLHDAGKSSCAWQAHLEATEPMFLRKEKYSGGPDHKGVGAWFAAHRCGLKTVGSLPILGHHGRLPNLTGENLTGVEPDARAEAFFATLEALQPGSSGGPTIAKRWYEAASRDPWVIEFLIRMLHSALVDADYLDTAAHFHGPAQRRFAPDMGTLLERFEGRRSELLKGRPPSPADAARQQVFEASSEGAELPPGIFRLPAPTGTGKTMSAAAFALRHAVRHGHRRVVVAVPFLTVTEQNAAVYRALLGADAVLEHHSAVEPEKLDKIGVENWDAPFVVTTTVQLFDSLFSGLPSKSRKLHRLARSVIVVDEVQAIPLHVVPTVMDGLRILVQYFGATVLLSSATQPALETLGVLKDRGVEIQELIAEPRTLYSSVKRTSTTWREVATQDEVVQLLAAEEQALLVVNTTAEARDIARALTDRRPGEVWHLSTRMCQEHRKVVLAEVRRRLDVGAPTILVSTQLIEAGVDVDFPAAFRAMAPADSLLQAAGRCNREGLRSVGRFVVLHGAGVRSIAAYRTAAAVTHRHFCEGQRDLDDPAEMAAYSRRLLSTTRPEEQKQYVDLRNARKKLLLETVGKNFRMIDDDSGQVIVPYDSRGIAMLAELVEAAAIPRGLSPEVLRRAQPFTVSLPQSVMSDREVKPYLRELVPGISVWEGPYDELVGVDTSRTPRDTVW